MEYTLGKLKNLIFGEEDPNNNNSTETDPNQYTKYDAVQHNIEMIKANWCKGLVNEMSGHCCHIFDSVERNQGKEPWGTFLDAGTGSHSLEWVIRTKSTRWTAVTGDNGMKQQLEEEFEDQLRDEDQIIVGNWKDPNFLRGQVFDTVLADYLLGSIDGFAPFFQDKLFERLKPHVGKKLYITGAEPFPDRVPKTNPHGQMIVEIAKTRDACILLAGERPYREYPLEWVLRYLTRAGYHIDGVSFFETVFSKSFVETQIDVAESKLKKIKSQEVANTMQNHLNSLRYKVKSMHWGVRFSHDYVVCATPIEKMVPIKQKELQTEDQVITESLKGTDYVSPVQVQKEVFPIDEYS